MFVSGPHLTSYVTGLTRVILGVTFLYSCTYRLQSSFLCADALILISLEASRALLYQEQKDIDPHAGSAGRQRADPRRLKGVVDRGGGDVNRGGTREEEGDAQPLRTERGGHMWKNDCGSERTFRAFIPG